MCLRRGAEPVRPGHPGPQPPGREVHREGRQLLRVRAHAHRLHPHPARRGRCGRSAGADGQLAARIAGASQKMLTQTLRTLERDGLVTRTVTPSVPVRVDYELTPLGQTLLPVLRAVKNWSEAHYPEIQAARDAYDQRSA